MFLPKVLSLSPSLCRRFSVYLHVFAEDFQFISMFMPKVLSLSLCFCQRFTVYLHVFATVFVNSIFSLLSLSFFNEKVKFYNTSSSLFSFPLQTQNPSHFKGQIYENQNLSIRILYTFSKIMTLKFHTFLGTRGVQLLPGLG